MSDSVQSTQTVNSVLPIKIGFTSFLYYLRVLSMRPQEDSVMPSMQDKAQP
jgi:hypothetical protein